MLVGLLRLVKVHLALFGSRTTIPHRISLVLARDKPLVLALDQQRFSLLLRTMAGVNMKAILREWFRGEAVGSFDCFSKHIDMSVGNCCLIFAIICNITEIYSQV